MGRVQRDGGIAALSEAERNAYVDDVGRCSLATRLNPRPTLTPSAVIERLRAAGYANISGAPAYADFFASTILYDEAAQPRAGARAPAACWSAGRRGPRRSATASRAASTA
ncbi:hypothetical protein JL720_16243 [Aureococcus anophagefferens]|nr:hypothetical protein JL720_16243 [Aureococcus anophagefferens]